MGTTLVRVAVMSESAIVREGIVAMLGELRDRAIVVDLDLPEAHTSHVDAVIFDLGGASGLSGYEQVRLLLGLDLAVIALVYDPVATVAQRADEGAAHVVTLAVTAEQLWAVVDRAVGGTLGQRHGEHRPTLPAGLTNREVTVLSLIGAGMSNHEIAERLYVSGNTVKTYIRTAYRKIAVRSRIQAALWALEHGLVARPVRENPTNGARATQARD